MVKTAAAYDDCWPRMALIICLQFELLYLRTKAAHLGDAYEQVQPHGAKEWGSVGEAAWGRRRERRRREMRGLGGNHRANTTP